MAISDNYSPDISYGNGVTTVFTGTWKVLNEDYFNCKLRNVSTGAEELLSNGSDYTLTFDDSGYQVTLTSAPSNEYQVIRYRSVSMDQSSPYKTSKGFQGAVIENSFDKITAIAQDMQDTVSRSLVRDIASNECDISGAVLHNVGAAIYNNDAVTKGYVDELAIIAGNVPSPAIGDVGSVLEATGEGLFDWVAPTVPEIALTDIADIAAGTMLVRLPGSGNGPPVAATMTAAGYSLMDDADAAAQLTTLGLYGTVIDRAYGELTTVLTGTTIIPFDDTIPTSSEGTALTGLTASITPKTTTNKLRVTVSVPVAAGTVQKAVAVALFVNGGGNAVAVGVNECSNNDNPSVINFTHEYIPGVTTAQTFTLRFGPSTATTITINGGAGARFFAGTLKATIVVEELRA